MIAAVVLAVATVAAATDPPAPPRDAANASFWRRFDNPPPDPLNPPRSWYEPLAPVAGAPGPFLPPASARTFDADTLDQAARYAQGTATQALIVVKDGRLVLERYFEGAGPTTLFSGHSLSKSVNGLMVGAAIDRGVIGGLDEPVSRHLPAWRDEGRRAITFRHLLTMSGGFRTPASRAPGSAFMQLYWGADLAGLVDRATPVAPPGTAYAYDGHNNEAIARALEAATGQSYQNLLSDWLWKPLGAADGAVLMDREGGRAFGQCCLFATARDWARLGLTATQGGVWRGRRILPAAFLQAARAPSAANDRFGFQTFLANAWLDPRINRQVEAQRATLAPSQAGDLVYWSGAGDVQVVMVPSRRLTIVRLGEAHPAYRPHVLANLLIDAETGAATGADYGWLLPWRLALPRPAARQAWERDPLPTWPGQRAPGAARPSSLPVRQDACLAGPAGAPGIALAERSGAHALLVWRGGALEIERYWRGAGPRSRIESASMHKTVTALLYGPALARGEIGSLDAPVAKWLTEWRADPRGAITLRQMLQMAGGLANPPAAPGATSPGVQMVQGPDFTGASLQLVQSRPAGAFNYNSGVSELLGAILARASGRPYADLLSERLLKPLGAGDAHLILDRPGGKPRTSASLYLEPADWVRIGRLFLDDGRVDGRRVLPKGWIGAMTAPSPGNPNFGLHVWRGSPYAPVRGYTFEAPDAVMRSAAPFAADDVVYLDGAVGQRVYAVPSADLVIVRLGENDRSWDDSALPNLVLEAVTSCAGAP